LAKCGQCGQEFRFFEVRNGVCQTCAAKAARLEERIEQEKRDQEFEIRRKKMIITTEMSVGLPVYERIGIVGAQCALGVNMFKDIFISGRDFWGGRSDTIQTEIELGRKTVIEELITAAAKAEADAVIAVSINFSEFSGGGGRMIFIAATGTAVRLGQGR
jgi:uncharacterized protein YbjQ (UPF0145 family)